MSTDRHFRVHGSTRSSTITPVRTADCRQAFEDFLAGRGQTLETIDASSAVELMIDFYVAIAAEDVDHENGGDMLLFQWGTDDWGSGPSFEYEVTRQLISNVGEDQDADDAFLQLSLTLHYAPTTEARATGSGEHWCSGLDGVDEFRRLIRDSAATALAMRFAPQRVELQFEPAG